MAKITVKGKTVSLKGDLPKIGKKAKDFKLTGADLADVGLSAFAGKLKILNCVPSLDTETCALSAKRFAQEAAKLPRLTVLTISRDLPFAQARFCKAEGISNMTFLSVLRDPGFAKAYGIEMSDGPLAGLLARAVFVLDENDAVRYVELVPDISSEPNYGAALHIVQYILGK
jgi:thiol peroxidase